MHCIEFIKSPFLRLDIFFFLNDIRQLCDKKIGKVSGNFCTCLSLMGLTWEYGSFIEESQHYTYFVES
jgi:hypothetical protein